MRPILPILALACGVAFGQSELPPPDQGQTGQEQKPDSTVDVKPGPPVIKQKDIWNETGFFHPFVRMPKYILQDQKAIWTSPFHTAKKDVKYWAVFALATVTFVAADRHIASNLPNSSAQVSVSNWISRIGSAYSLIPISTAFYVIGTANREERKPG
jgi:hypothetical protein